MEVIPVNGGSPAAGHSLKDVAATRAHGVQIAGIRRQGTKILNPSGEETICTGDDLLVLGTAVQIDGFEASVRTVVGVAPAENEGITF
jgi:K+/H+ antiporter YhaU regulatory subunit KhtT